MENFYYNLSGGINQASTKTELGLNTKNLYWTDAQNIEIYRNKGIIRQKGNVLFAQIPQSESITAIHEMKSGDKVKLLISTDEGHLYVYEENNPIVLLNKTISSLAPVFTNFLNGTIVSSESDEMFFINSNLGIEDCNLVKSNNTPIYARVVAVYKGRVWAVEGSTIYFSALGKYNDFTTVNDAGYINNFYTDTDDITALCVYKDYLAIYKEKRVYLLGGSSPDDFAVIPFADKGAYSQKAVVTVNNKQYFYCSGIYTLEVGALNQVLLGSEITEKIKEEFRYFDYSRKNETFAINYEVKNQVWYFIPYVNDEYFHTIWINDIVNKAWYKRVLPQDITAACLYKNYILTADKDGKIYKEDVNNSFNGEPIKFMWKSPFLGLGNPTVRKAIDEFYFILDEEHENNFKFSVYKNFDAENKDDVEQIYSNNFENLVWYKGNSEYELNFKWSGENNTSVWSLDTEAKFKSEISEANYSVQICIEGDRLEQNASVIGLQFKEIYNEE